MSAGHTISTAPSSSHVEVRLAGEVLADTRRPILLDETGLPTRYYLPREDVRMDLLEQTSFHTTCPFKGEASYWSANIGGERQDGLVWSYETPLPVGPRTSPGTCPSSRSSRDHRRRRVARQLITSACHVRIL